MKKIIISILLFAIFLLSFSGCAAPMDNEKINIVCTLFPQYDWIKNIIGNSESLEVTLLIQNGTDPHSYQPTAADIMTLSNCDMVVYMGAQSDVWVKEALQRANNNDTVKVALSEINGMTLREISSSSHNHDQHGHNHNDSVLDEHLWLSLKNAIKATEHLTDKICELDPENADKYKANSEKYKGELISLDADFAKATKEAGEHPFMLFADRFPFVYLLSDYDVHFAAAFEGCTTDTDAGFDTVLRLIKEAEEHGISHIAVTESSDKSLAKTVASSTKGDIEIIVMNSLQGVTKKQLSEGVTYLSEMKKNLTAMKIALGVKGE